MAYSPDFGTASVVGYMNIVSGLLAFATQTFFLITDGFDPLLHFLLSGTGFLLVGLGAYQLGRSSRSKSSQDQDSNAVATEGAS